jgi:hypothetical protein
VPDRQPAAAPPRPLPLGPGGRPFRGWRIVPLLLAFLAFAVNLAILLSDRAPGLFRRLSLKVDAGVARAASAAGGQSDVRIPQSDVDIHIALWAVATLLVGLAMWSWASLFLGACGVLCASLVVEGSQAFLTATRTVQASDAAANLVGVVLGLAAVVAIAGGWRLARAAVTP